MSNACLIEVGTEELPPRALLSLAQHFARQVEQGLRDHNLQPGSVEIFATLPSTPLNSPLRIVMLSPSMTLTLLLPYFLCRSLDNALPICLLLVWNVAR